MSKLISLYQRNSICLLSCALLSIVLILLTGCAHKLDISNLSTYQNTSLNSTFRTLKVGINTTVAEMDDKRVVKLLADALSKYNVLVSTVTLENQDELDAVINVGVVSDYHGSGWNFLINFPGFLVFAPAWHGYHYTVEHDINIAVNNAATGKLVKRIHMPVSLNIRHSDMNRTWTEISYLEVGVIALVGGVLFTQYDDEITSDVTDKAGPVIADYAAQEIVNALKSIPDTAVTRMSQKSQSNIAMLNQLLEDGILSFDEYKTKMSYVDGVNNQAAVGQ